MSNPDFEQRISAGKDASFRPIVVIPYGLGWREGNGTRNAGPRLTHFAAFSLNTAREYYTDLQKVGKPAKIILCGSDFFGTNVPSENDLMEDALRKTSALADIAARNLTEEEEKSRRGNLASVVIPEDDIVRIGGSNENTAVQIKNLKAYQAAQGASMESMTVIVADFHKKRVKKYVEKFQLQGLVVNASELHNAMGKKFNKRAYDEQMRSVYASYAKQDRIARLIPPVLLNLLTRIRGPRQVDIERTAGGLRLSTKTAHQIRTS